MTKCSAPNCNNSQKKDSVNISFHEFPQDPVLRMKWITNIGRSNWTPGRRSVICSAHFEKTQFKEPGPCHYLIEEAVPLLFQPSTKRSNRTRKNAPSSSQDKKFTLDQLEIQDPSLDSSLPLRCPLGFNTMNKLPDTLRAGGKTNTNLNQEMDNQQLDIRANIVSEKFMEDFVLVDDTFILDNMEEAELRVQSAHSSRENQVTEESGYTEYCSESVEDVTALGEANPFAQGNVIIVESTPTTSESCPEIYILPENSQPASENVILIQPTSGKPESVYKQMLNLSNIAAPFSTSVSSTSDSELIVPDNLTFIPDVNSKMQTVIVPKLKRPKLLDVKEEPFQEHAENSSKQSSEDTMNFFVETKEDLSDKQLEQWGGSCAPESTDSVKKSIVNLPAYLDDHILGRSRKKHGHLSVKWQDGTYMCRLCGIASNKTVNVFSSEANDVKLLERISSVLPIMFDKSDNLPKSVCTKCMNQLDMCSELIVNSFNTQRQLASVMGQDVEQLSQMPVFFHGKQKQAQTNPGWKRHILLMDIYHEENKPLKDYLAIACDDLRLRLDLEVNHQSEKTQCSLVLATISDDCNVSQTEQVRTAAEALISSIVIQEEINKKEPWSHSEAVQQDCNETVSVTSDDGIATEHLQLPDFAEAYVLDPSEVQVMPVMDDASPVEVDSANVRFPKLDRVWQSGSIPFRKMQNLVFWQSSRDGQVELACRLCKDILDGSCNIQSHLDKHCKKRRLSRENLDTSISGCSPMFYPQHDMSVNKCDQKSPPKRIQPLRSVGKRVWNFINKQRFCPLYQCSFCSACFKSKLILKQHLQKHHVANATCEGCGHEATDICEATVHRQSCSKLKKEMEWRCRKCLEIFPAQKELQEHHNSTGHDNNKPSWLCDVCGKRYPQAAKLYQHKKSHLPPEFKYIHQCPHCSKRYINLSRLREHMQKHEEKKYMCKVCGKLFSTKQILRQHEFTHGDPQFLCSICSRTFFRKSHLLKHMNVHNPENARASRAGPQPHRDGLNRCRECRQVFESQDLLNHYKMVHPLISLHNYVCEICKEENTSYAELFQHQREVHKTGVKDCPFCDKTIDSSTQMKYHLMRHEGMFPYNCPLCSNGYTANSVLQDHIRRKHTGEKPFECQQCLKRFPTSGALAQHSTVHSLPHQLLPCPVCNQGFKRKAHLDVHIRTHTGEKPYPCPICDRPFRQRPDCVKHIRVIHGKDPSKFNIQFHPNMCVAFPQVVSVADMELVLEGEDLMQTSLQVNQGIVNQ